MILTHSWEVGENFSKDAWKYECQVYCIRGHIYSMFYLFLRKNKEKLKIY